MSKKSKFSNESVNSFESTEPEVAEVPAPVESVPAKPKTDNRLKKALSKTKIKVEDIAHSSCGDTEAHLVLKNGQRTIIKL